MKKLEIIFRVHEKDGRIKEVPIFCVKCNNTDNHLQDDSLINIENLKINPKERIVWGAEKKINLTSKEFDILLFLASHPGQVFTHRQIYETVWGKEYFCDEGNVTAHIGRIRKKIESDPRNPIFIKTVRGVGYKFVKK
ncbi:winged helix-turn-helix domain-containing protein [Blautia producta]|uniref:winged helix-turn-helix domain-containing protein n=1 Tax=Blautia producta TaxID=33035 RepID=UPI0035BE5636